MKEPTRTHLKIMVERAVRPVPVGTTRKLRIREELLAHVTAVFEEEVTRLGDEPAALQRTQERFGNPDELAGQLLKSVPAKDVSERFMERIVFLTLVWLALFGVAEFPPFPGRFLLDFCLGGVGCIFLADLMRRAFHGPPGRSRHRSILIAAASLFLFLGLLFSWLEFWFDGWSKPTDMVNIFMLMALLTWGLVTPMLEAAARFRAQLEWESLQIE
jgi:hypothetical protein